MPCSGRSERQVTRVGTVVYGQTLREVGEGSEMVLSGGVCAGLAVMAVALAACGSPTPSRTSSPTAAPTATPRPSAAAGACASVMTTTPIEQVPAACAALWAPYGVTKVPPANLTDGTPVPTTVVNGTKGAVADADAQKWALAVNRTGVWLRWSEANDQFQLTTHLESPQVVNGIVDAAMRRGTRVTDPDCDLFAQRYLLVANDVQGTSFFSSFGQSIRDMYVFIERYPGPCAITVDSQSGSTQTLLATPVALSSISAGNVLDDPVLGDIWFGDGAALCTTRGAPTAWCAS